MANIDPVCLAHGLHYSEHVCVICCLCFKTLQEEDCHVRADGLREDVCNECAAMEFWASWLRAVGIDNEAGT